MTIVGEKQGADLDGLARELWEAHATDHQVVIPLPTLHWDELDPFTQEHWRVVGRTALAFRRPLLDGVVADSSKAADLLAAVLSHADFERSTERLAYASLAIPPALLDEAFAVVGALRD